MNPSKALYQSADFSVSELGYFFMSPSPASSVYYALIAFIVSLNDDISFQIF